VVRVSEILFGGDPAGADAATLADLAAEIPTAPWTGDDDLDVLDVLLASGAARSRGEGRRLVEQGGIQINGRPVADLAARLGPGHLLAGRYLIVRRGKRDFRALVRGGDR
jgi:tyrosyl-tRNA synthetase